MGPGSRLWRGGGLGGCPGSAGGVGGQGSVSLGRDCSRGLAVLVGFPALGRSGAGVRLDFTK